MPAAELTRLRMQINGLIERFGDPAAFRIGLRDLLEMYSNRAYRAGQAAPPQSLLPSYRVPPLIIRELELQLGRTCQERPAEALCIVEVLWRDEYLEPRQLAAALLGVIPISQGEGVIQKLREWSQANENFRMLETLFKNGTTELRREAPELLLKLIEDWLNSHKPDMQGMGLRAVVPLIDEQRFENLPPIFRMVGPLVQNIPSPLHADVQTVVEALIRRSPTETAYFLRQTLSLATGPGTARLIRRCLPAFAPAQQASLRTALQAASSE